VKELVLFMVKRLADHPERVEVKESEQAGLVTLELTVAEEDKGRIIGKQGKVIKAIRSVVSAAASKAGKKTVVEVE
jgi:predicted RNA-binding protein YlqC (UPF0109 family)